MASASDIVTQLNKRDANCHKMDADFSDFGRKIEENGIESDEVLQSLITPYGFVRKTSHRKTSACSKRSQADTDIDITQPARDLVEVVASFLDILEGCSAYFWELTAGRYSLFVLTPNYPTSSHTVHTCVLPSPKYISLGKQW